MIHAARRIVPLLACLLAGVAEGDGAALERGAEILKPFKKELMGALQQGLQRGPAGAIEVCQLRAPEIAASISVAGIEVGRTSHRLRNPENVGPEWTSTLLADYLASADKRQPRAVPLGDDRWGYVEPIVLQPLCLTCHGETLSPDIAERIDVVYPDDRATGFAVGDLRGIFWVEFTIENMQLVPGATFRMGSDPDELPRIREITGLGRDEPLLPEIPSHEVTVDDFFMDSHDVTNRQFERFVTERPEWRKGALDTSLHNGRYLEHWETGKAPGHLLDHPVTFITWQAAVAYCDWAGKRLPSEAEYEWAAQDPEKGGEYPWGDSAPDDALVSWGGNGINTTVPVGSYPPNARGLYDMAGNVWHFVSDPWAGAYGEMLARPDEYRRLASNASVRRVLRGGSWGANAANLRVRYRDSHRPYDAREMVGFRCARDGDS